MGDAFFDAWPKNLAGQKPGTILRTRDVTRVAAPLVTVPIRYAQQIKFVSTDALGQPSFEPPRWSSPFPVDPAARAPSW